MLLATVVYRPLAATVTAALFLATGCGADRPWPTRPYAVTAQSFAQQTQVATIDILPLDLQMWAQKDYSVNLDELRGMAEVNLMNTALDTLTKRNYAIGAMIGWDGASNQQSVLSKDDLMATLGSLGTYGQAVEEHPNIMPTPFLPARLGVTTGSDATLYVGGWSYVAKKKDSGSDIGEAILVGLLIISVVAIIAIALDSKSSKSSKSGGHKGSSGGSKTASAPHRVDHRGGVTVPVIGGTNGGSHHGGRVDSIVGSTTRVHHTGGFRTARVGGAMLDAFGRTAVDLAIEAPDWSEDAAPSNEDQPETYLEMTLVDNHTGNVLWHAHQVFPASAESAKDMARVARTMMAKMPPRLLQTASN